MKVCFICCEYPPGPHGGVGTAVQMLGRGLTRRGHEVVALGVYSRTHPAPALEYDSGVRVERLPARSYRMGWVLDRLQLLWRVRQLVQNGVEIVEAPADNGWLAFLPPLRAPCVIRAQKTYSWQATGIGKRPNPRIHWLEGVAFRRADAWVASSAFTAEWTQRVHGLKCRPYRVMYNAVEIEPRVQASRRIEPGLIVYAGSLTEKKGVLTLIRAFNEIQAVRPSARLELYGKDLSSASGGSMKAALSRQLTPPALSRTLFAGHVPREQLHVRLMQASVAVFPSYGEAFGFAAVEAMALGCPVVYTRLPCGPELIDHGVDGLLADPSSSSELATAVLSLLDDPIYAQKLGIAAARKVQERFSLDRWLDETEEFYRAAIRDHARGWNWLQAVEGG